PPTPTATSRRRRSAISPPAWARWGGRSRSSRPRSGTGAASSSAASTSSSAEGPSGSGSATPQTEKSSNSRFSPVNRDEIPRRRRALQRRSHVLAVKPFHARRASSAGGQRRGRYPDLALPRTPGGERLLPGGRPLEPRDPLRRHRARRLQERRRRGE